MWRCQRIDLMNVIIRFIARVLLFLVQKVECRRWKDKDSQEYYTRASRNNRNSIRKFGGCMKCDIGFH